MNYDEPRQIASGPDAGKWHFTSANRRTGTHPIGYCRDHGGHDTELQARECYTKYLMDNRVRYDNTLGHWNPCEADGCDELTCHAAVIDGWHSYLLCDDHMDREHVEALFGLAGNSMHS